MPRIYCTRYPHYSLYDRDVCYQFRDGVLDTDEAGERFLRSRPESGSLFIDTPAPAEPQSSSLWKVETPRVLPAVQR
jgi:hypothetical protein